MTKSAGGCGVACGCSCSTADSEPSPSFPIMLSVAHRLVSVKVHWERDGVVLHDRIPGDLDRIVGVHQREGRGLEVRRLGSGAILGVQLGQRPCYRLHMHSRAASDLEPWHQRVPCVDLIWDSTRSLLCQVAMPTMGVTLQWKRATQVARLAQNSSTQVIANSLHATIM